MIKIYEGMVLLIMSSGRSLSRKFFILIALLLVFPVMVSSCDAENENAGTEPEEAETRTSILTEEITYENHYQAGIDMDFFWQFDAEGEELHIRLESPGSGWMAVGFEPSTRMQDAKMVIAGFKDDEFLLEEHIGTSPPSHEQIEDSYIVEYAGEYEEELTVAEFVLPLTGDTRYELQSGEEYEVIFAYHDDDDNFLQRHSQRSSAEVEF